MHGGVESCNDETKAFDNDWLAIYPNVTEEAKKVKESLVAIK